MINDFCNKFISAKDEFIKYIESSEKIYSGFNFKYKDLLKKAVELINPDEKDGLPDKDRMYEINDGEYEGTIVFVMAETGDQPSKYWYTMVYYGSCSGCDALEAAENANDYYILTLHMIQKMKKMEDDFD